MRLQSVFLILVASAAGLSAQGAMRDESGIVEEIVVGGSQVAAASVYAGGQVARGSRAGLFGNLDTMESPFSATAYTEALARGQQAISIGDVLENDPTVRVAKGFGNFQEVYIVRGFPVFSDDMTFNGLYGILPRQFVAAELVERVEVFRGANSFVNGASPGASGVGGLVNLLPKRAPEEELTRLTAGLEAPSQLYGALDLGRRFGTEDAYGVRLNAVRRDGETSVEDQERELTLLSLGTDYSGERLRFSADLGFQDHRIDDPRPQVTPTGEIPSPPNGSENFAQPWTFTDERQLFGALRGEWDASENATLWLAIGGRNGEEANVLANPNSDVAGVTSAFRFDNAREDKIWSADAGVRVDFSTGSIDHRLIVAGSLVDLESRNAFAFSSFAGFANDLYDPTPVTPPTPDAFVGGDLSNPLRTEAVDNRSLAVADLISFLDGRVLATVGLRQQWIETRSFDAGTGAETGSYDEDALTPSLGLVYRWSDELSLYGNYAESVQPGQVAPANVGGEPVLNAGEVLDPFRGEQLELGVKYDRGRFGGTASLFTLTQPSAIVRNGIFGDNGEELRRGLELSVFGEPVDGVRLLGGVTWLDAELAKTQGGINEGNRPIGVPEFQLNVNGEWDAPAIAGLTVEARLLYTSEQEANAANTVALDSWTRVDVGARIERRLVDRRVTARLRLENVLGEDYWASTGGFPGANYLVLAEPLTLRLSASVEL
ncbi:MAG: TonB-dependent siderophore receptor [Pseudomonadales bacterium]|jgi:iron complex outermembrane receptor protein|nr:TonB-dependent siderophore receptor [Pseudomonadales bacterium]